MIQPLTESLTWRKPLGLDDWKNTKSLSWTMSPSTLLKLAGRREKNELREECLLKYGVFTIAPKRDKKENNKRPKRSQLAAKKIQSALAFT